MPNHVFRATLTDLSQREMPDRPIIDAVAVDPELLPGARNAIRICLRLKPEERITIITDEATADITAALEAEIAEVGSDFSVFVLEHHARHMGQPSRRRNLHCADEHQRCVRG